MPFRFRKTLKIAPGVKINLSKSGISTSIGKAGATVNIGKKGIKTTEGIPGTGISFSQHIAAPKPNNSASVPTSNLSQNQGCCLGSLLSLVFKFIFLVISAPFRLLSWAFKPERRKIAIIVIVALFSFFCCFPIILGSLLPEPDSATVPQPTSTFTPTETFQPTQPTTSTATPSSFDVSSHVRTIETRLLSVRDALDDLAAVELEYGKTPDLYDDNNWYFKSTNILYRLQTATKELSEMESNNDSRFEILEKMLEELSEMTDTITSAYIQGIDNKDTDSIQKSMNQIVYIEEKLAEILEELNNLK